MMNKTTVRRALTAGLLAAVFLVLLVTPREGFSAEAARKVAILPWKVNSAGDAGYLKDAVVDMLSSRIGSSGSEVIAAEAAEKAVGAGTVTDAVAKKAASSLKADYVLYGSLTVIGSTVSLDAKLLDAASGSTTPFYSKGAGLDSVVGLAERLAANVVSSVRAAAASTGASVPTPATSVPVVAPLVVAPPAVTQKTDSFIKMAEKKPRPELWKSRLLDGAYLAMTSADLDRDGVPEFFLMTSGHVVVARMDGDDLRIIKEFPGGGQNVAITAADTDHDGAAEVYVSKVVDNRPSTSVLEYRDNSYKFTVTRAPWLVRTIDYKGKTLLIGQAFSLADGFQGPLRVLAREGSKLADKGPFEVELPRRVALYGFDAFAFSGSAEPEVVALDDRDYLRVYKLDNGDWAEVFKSSDYYGGTLNRINFTEDVPVPGSSHKPPVDVEGRFYHLDLNNDGHEELIIKSNVPGGFGRLAERPMSYTKGTIISLSFEGDELTENWRTKEIRGYIADFFLSEPGPDGAREINILVVTGTGALFGKQKSYILSYKLSI